MGNISNFHVNELLNLRGRIGRNEASAREEKLILLCFVACFVLLLSFLVKMSDKPKNFQESLTSTRKVRFAYE
jgi:hypothetical protein